MSHVYTVRGFVSDYTSVQCVGFAITLMGGHKLNTTSERW